MPRTPNTKGPTKPQTVVTFQPHEFRWLQWNEPGPSGKLGGYPRHENWTIENTDKRSLAVILDPVRLERTIRYIKPRDKGGYGPGGPNGRLRRAYIPALRRIGIDVMPDWSVR